MNKFSLCCAQHCGALDRIKRIRPRFLAIRTRAAHRITSPIVALTWRMSCTCRSPRKSNKVDLGLTVSVNRPRTYLAAVVKVAATARNRGRQFYRCPFRQDKTADCKFFRWASDQQQTAEESFVGESSMGVYNPNSKFNDREFFSVPKSPQTRIVDDESVGNDALLDELRSLRVKVALVEQRLRLGVVALYALVMALSVLCVLHNGK
ncbi:hypothetical protein LINGRAHAP2_LOCUS17253 [Linum grandiflorum]